MASSTVVLRAPAFSRTVSWFETMPGWLFYIPSYLYYIFLAIFVYRSPTLLLLADPAIPAGGLWGESKNQVLSLLGPTGRKYTMPYVYMRVAKNSTRAFKEASRLLKEAGITYPFVAKPDVSCRGRAVRIIRSKDQLAHYLEAFPLQAGLILQKYCAYEGEAGVFYVRKPGETKGMITSITLKYFPSITGDGVSTVRELIERDPRAAHFKAAYFERNRERLNEIPKRGESVRLVSVGNHCRGAIFRDGTALATAELTAYFDAITNEMEGFYMGRFDVRFPTIENLKRGKSVAIIEFNGIGSEPTHIWDANVSIIDAYRMLFYHLRLAFRIGYLNRARGHVPPPLFAALKMGYKQSKLVAQYPAELETV